MHDQITPCGHVFCYICMMKLYDRHKASTKCALCKRLTPQEKIYHIKDKPQPAQPQLPAVAAATAAADAADARAAAAADATSGTPAPLDAAAGTGAAAGGSTAAAAAAEEQPQRPRRPVPAVKGSYGTKVEALVELLLTLQLEAPGDKTIVFSQWSKVLQIVSVALKQNGLIFADAYSKGGRLQDAAVQVFKSKASVNVLLLATKSGSNGLNLTEAVNIVLVEPVMNPAVEAQAVSRVLRIGQTRETHVYRLYITDTIEQRILRARNDTHGPSEGGTASAVDGQAGQGAVEGVRQRSADAVTIGDLRALFGSGPAGGAGGGGGGGGEGEGEDEIDDDVTMVE